MQKSSEVLINAPREVVIKHWYDHSKYPKWNSGFIKREQIRGEYRSEKSITCDYREFEGEIYLGYIEIIKNNLPGSIVTRNQMKKGEKFYRKLTRETYFVPEGLKTRVIIKRRLTYLTNFLLFLTTRVHIKTDTTDPYSSWLNSFKKYVESEYLQ